MVGHAAPSRAVGAESGAEADVWTIALDARMTEVALPADTLSRDEVERCARYRHPVHRERFRIGRAALRSILSLYAGVPPAELVFTYGSAGKPRLVGEAHRTLHFSFSRAEGMALLAVALEPLGIDVASIDPRFASAGVASAAFDRSEVQAWSCLPERSRTPGFFKGWTSREAVVKAEGTGLGSPSRFSVCVDPACPPRILRGAADWRLHRVECAATHEAAICTPSTIETLRMLRWDGSSSATRHEADHR